MGEGLPVGVQPPEEKKPKGYELKRDPRFDGSEVAKGSQTDLPDWAKGRGPQSKEQAQQQIQQAMDKLKQQITPDLYSRVLQAIGKPDGDEFREQVIKDLKQELGEDGFAQFNADTTVSMPFEPYANRGASPSGTSRVDQFPSPLAGQMYKTRQTGEGKVSKSMIDLMYGMPKTDEE